MSTKDRIKMLVMDVDGTMTDGKIYMGDAGEVFKAFSIKDGMGIRLLRKAGVIPVILTGRYSKIVENRAEELGIDELYQGIHQKAEVLRQLADKYSLEYKNIAYIGDDINDLPAMEVAGLTFAPKDAAKTVLERVDIILEAMGGAGAVREAVEIILSGNEGLE